MSGANRTAFKNAKLVDFTGKINGYTQMKGFGPEFVDLVRNCKDGSKAVVVVDHGFSGRYASPLLVRDHLNLSGDNPLIGHNDPKIGERFPIVQGIYLTDALKGVSTGVVAGLKEGVKPNSDEQKLLRTIGADICSYNLVPSMLIAAHAGWKVLGILLPDDGNLSTEQIDEIRELTGSK